VLDSLLCLLETNQGLLGRDLELDGVGVLHARVAAPAAPTQHRNAPPVTRELGFLMFATRPVVDYVASVGALALTFR
jgi:hypothetical protein